MKLKLAVIAVVAALAIPALAYRLAPRPGSAASSAAVASAQPAAARPSYGSMLYELDVGIAALRARADKVPDQWLVRQQLAARLLERAQLTGQLSDYSRVEQVLDEAFAIAADGSGPLALAARFEFALHRLDLAEKHLARIDAKAFKKTDEQLGAMILRAQIAFQRGEYEDAVEGLRFVAEARPGAARGELALALAKTGRAAEAEALLEDAYADLPDDDARSRAWTKVQLGRLALDRGALHEAAERFREADAELPGWWFVREQLAEAHHLRGEDDKAVAIYETLVREQGLAQHMDLLTQLYEHKGKRAESEALARRARETWAKDLARYPEAAMGHGLEHALTHGTAAEAVALAEANAAMRPGGEAQIGLARAYLKAGDPAHALAIARRALATPYRSASLHDVASLAHAALGHTTEAAEERELCALADPWFALRQHTH